MHANIILKISVLLLVERLGSLRENVREVGVKGRDRETAHPPEPGFPRQEPSEKMIRFWFRRVIMSCSHRRRADALSMFIGVKVPIRWLDIRLV